MDTEQPSVEERLEAFIEADAAEDEEAAPADAGQAEDDAEPEVEAEEEAEETDDEEEVEDVEAAPAGTIEVEIDGQTQRLTAEQVRDGILMRSDYTRKTQQLAEREKQFEAERQQAAAVLRQQFEALQGLQETEPDWDKLYDEDPLGAPKIERDWRERNAKRQEVAQQQALQQEQRRQQHLATQAALLPELIPEWTNAEVAQREQTELRQALIDDGFDEQDVALVGDARLVKWLRAAHAHFKAQKVKKDTAKKKVAGKPKVQKPGSAVKPSAKSAQRTKLDHARKTQSNDAWVKVLEDYV